MSQENVNAGSGSTFEILWGCSKCRDSWGGGRTSFGDGRIQSRRARGTKLDEVRENGAFGCRGVNCRKRMEVWLEWSFTRLFRKRGNSLWVRGILGLGPGKPGKETTLSNTDLAQGMG